jgi:Uma2 family endonuclease
MVANSSAAADWTYDRYAELDDDQRYEIIDGVLLMTPAPGTRHQMVLTRLAGRLIPFVDKNQLGTLLLAPTDVVLAPNQVVQPDLLFVSSARAGIVDERAVNGAPDLVVEILSPTSLHLDRHRKFGLYESAGVREFWLVDPANKGIEISRNTPDGFDLETSASEAREVGSKVLVGLRIELSELFA